MEIELLAEVRTSGQYENIFTTNNIYSRYASADHISNPKVFNTAKTNIDIMARLEYLPTLTQVKNAHLFSLM